MRKGFLTSILDNFEPDPKPPVLSALVPVPAKKPSGVGGPRGIRSGFLQQILASGTGGSTPKRKHAQDDRSESSAVQSIGDSTMRLLHLRTAPRRSPWYQQQQSPHPSQGRSMANLEAEALQTVGRVINADCNLYWFDRRCAIKCPNKGSCFPGVVQGALRSRGHSVVTEAMKDAIKSMYYTGTKANPTGDRRAQRVLKQLSSWSTTSRKGRIQLHFKIPEAGNVEVCRYAYARWYGLRPSMINSCCAAARRGETIKNPSQVLGRTGRKVKYENCLARAWVCKHLRFRMRAWHPSHGTCWIDKICIKDLYENVYCEEEGADAVSLKSFTKFFTAERKRLNIKWRTVRDHLGCDYCAQQTKIIKNSKLMGTCVHDHATRLYNAHQQDCNTELGMYYAEASRSRRPGSKVLSLCTDKATSNNTAHPHLARSDRSKGTGNEKIGKLDFSLQGVLQHGHAFHLFGLYPWLSSSANYWYGHVYACTTDDVVCSLTVVV